MTKSLINLQVGLTAKCASQCVTSLTICTLEMRDAMNKLLSEVLLNLSKISATVYIAIPIIEFLSSEFPLVKDECTIEFFYLICYTNFLNINFYFSSNQTSKSFCQLYRRSIYVCICNTVAIYQSFQVQPLYGISGLPCNRCMVFEMQTSFSERFC